MPKTVWFDLDNSPHVLIFQPIIKHLRNYNVNIIITARNYAQTLPLLDMYGLEYIRVDGHGGKTKIKKIGATIYRAFKLRQVIRKIVRERGEVNLMISHGSRAGIIAARILNIPIISGFDYEHAEISLFLKFSNVILVPNILSDKLPNYKKIIFYPGLKEEIYLCEFQPDISFLYNLPFEKMCNKPLVLIRPPATQAHYHNPLSEKLYNAVLDKILESDCNVILIPRTKDNIYSIKKTLKFSDRIYIPDKTLDGPNLVYHSDLVISGGGTMLREAAILGTPAYSIFTGKPPSIDLKLERENKLTFIKTIDDVNKIQIKKKEKKDLIKPPTKVRDFFINVILENLERKK
jgi:hypothetical protein